MMSKDVAAPQLDSQVEASGAGRRRNRGLVLLLLLLLALVVVAPLMTTIAMGPDSYLRIHRSYPGPLTGILTTLARIAADVSSLLTAGALVATL